MSISTELNIEKYDDCIKVYKGNKCIIMPVDLEVYTYDLKMDFDLYFDAVKSQIIEDYLVVDYRINKLHDINGYNLHKVMLPSLTEALSPSLQYLKLADIDENSVVLDLGAYCGLTAILFDNEISKNNRNANGQVITVEADPKNLISIEYNLGEYKKVTGRTINFLHAAVWNENSSIKFASQGYMGASAYHVGHNRGEEVEVPTYKLSTIAEKFNLEKVDFIKCDIEGAEAEIFKDKKFFEKYSPKIIIECHFLDLEQTQNTKSIVIDKLEEYGYSCSFIVQEGFNLPLLLCLPLNEKYKSKISNLEIEKKNLLERIYILDVTFLQQIFSIRNECNHKVVRILGIKLKLRKNKK